MDVDSELKKLGEEEEKLAKWVNYFIKRFKAIEDENAQLKKDVAELKKKNEILGRSVLTLFEKKKNPPLRDRH